MADIQKLNVNNTTYDISTTWEKVTGKPSTFPPESHTHSYLPLSGGTIKGNVYISGNNVTNVPFNILTPSAGNTGYIRFGAGTSSSTELGHIGFSAKGVPAINYQGVVNTLIHSGNYNSYAPTLTGTGASGTWGIDISGNAFSATKLQTPRNIWGQSFDGTGDVGGILHGVTRVAFSSEGYISNLNGFQAIDLMADYINIGYGYAVRGKNTFIGGNNLYLRYGVSQNTGILLNSSGNVLIGTATDNGYKLQVNGSERVYGDLIVDGEVSALVA